MISLSELQSFFEIELKRKLTEKARNPLSEMKTLLNCFKYYDTNYEGQIDKTLWIKGILRTGITNFTEDDLDKLFNCYVQSNSDKINYKEFCKYIYGQEDADPLSQSLKNINLNENVITGNTNRNNYASKGYQKINLNQFNNKNYNFQNNQNRAYENNYDKSNDREVQQYNESELLVKPENRINKYSNLNYNSDNSFGDDNIGINSIFLGVSKTQRPKYDYNYDYLEEFSKSSPNPLGKRKNKNKYGNNSKNNNISSSNNSTNNFNDAYNRQILNYSYKKNNQTQIRNNLRNNEFSTIGEKIVGDYENINANINHTNSYSNTLPVKNSYNILRTPGKYCNYESRKTPQYKGIKVFKTQRHNPITDPYNQENINEKNMSDNSNVLVIENNIQTPSNNLYIRNNYNQSNNQNNYIKEEIGTVPENKENDINDKNEEINQNEIENQNNKLKENSSLIKFRNVLISQGAKSLFRFQRMLSIYDRKHSGLISFDNFYAIFKAYFENIPLADIKSIFSLFDTSTNPNDNSNIKNIAMFQIKYDELLKSLIGSMSLSRKLIVKKVFDSFEKENDGKIITSDIKTKFNYNRHPDVLSGKNTGIELYNDFLDFLETFREYNDNLIGGYSFSMSYDEFEGFYSMISLCVEDDDYFEKILKNCWNLEKENTDANMNINSYSNNANLSNNYQRTNQINEQNIRMKTGSQIINNNIF